MNRVIQFRHTIQIGLFLALAMAGTRFHHFNEVLNLPDASLAVFFLAGFFLQSLFYFPLFFAEAALLDLGTFAVGGSDWCFTPAYLFLVPAYGIVWWAGRFCGKRDEPFPKSFIFSAGILWAGLSAAFVLSNTGFYLFSGYFGDMDATKYTASVSSYYPSYVINAFIYAALTLGVYAFFVSRTSKRIRNEASGRAVDPS